MATADPMQSSGQGANILGKFRLLAELGRGGMSEVYLAVIAGPANFNKLVVVKLIKAELAEDPDFIGMFLEEARLSARLNHPNVVQTNEVGNFGGRYFIAMEYLEGQPYSRILHRLGRDRGLPLGMSLRLLSDVLAGLQYAHDLADFDGTPLGVVHRDVTPHNIFITYDGQVKVVDFGIAKAMNSSHETRTGMLKGKVGYMAPEQARGERVDRRADIFSVGVMLWEAAVGRRLWKGMNEVQILHQLLAGDIPRPRSMRPDISDRLEQIILKSLAPNRDDRYASCSDLQADLEDLMDAGGERNALREVGRVVTQAFEEERKKLKVIVEQQLARSNVLATGAYQAASIPFVEQPPHLTGEMPMSRQSFTPPGALPQLGYQMAHTGSGPSYTGSSHPGAAPMVHSGSHPAYGPQDSSIPSFHTVPVSGSYPGHAHQSSPSVTTGSIARASVSRPGTHPGPHPQADANRRVTMIALGVAAAAGVLAALLYVGLGRPKENAAPAASTALPLPASAAPAAPASAAAPARELKITVAAEPPETVIFLDGRKVDGNPYTTTLVHDGKEHELRLEAPGHEPRLRTIRADELNVVWDVELAPPQAPPRVGGGVRTAPPPTKEDPMKTPTKGPKRQIDTNYPGG